uniref:VIgL family C1q-related protein 6 isoform 1 n=1 Tax=Littorina littorea TaxID=31216 RepID=A0A411DEM9_LITLI|nr:VIgL family C1q-related protein 6 isoform 1 [Littorina littorea]
MLRRFAQVVFILTVLVDDIRSQRSSQDFGDGEMVYSCAGGQALFPWEAELGANEVIVHITWTFQGVFSTVTMATFSHHALFVSEDYEDRVQQVGITGIVLSKLTAQDTGNYSVELSAHNSSSFFFTTIRHATLQVGDKLMAVDHRVRASQLAEAQRDDVGRWSVALACGHFTHLTQPPFKVEWTAPSGDTVPSTRYEDGHFILVLSNPVKGGNYTCSLPQLFVKDACADDMAAREGRTEDTVMVDETKARVSLLEAHVVSLLEENRDLQNTVDTLKTVDDRTSHRLEDIEDTLDKEVSGRKAADTNTSRTLGSLDDRLQNEISVLKATDTNVSHILSSLEVTLQNETTVREMADTNTSRILGSLKGTLDKEVSGRKAADTNTSRILVSLKDTLEKEVSGLKAADLNTCRELASLEMKLENVGKQTKDLSGSGFSFNARLSSNTKFNTRKQKLQWDQVILNKGSAYDPNTGFFTAPVNGLYFFALTTRSGTSFAADAEIMAGNVRVCRLDSNVKPDVGSCQGAIELSKDQQVWVQSFEQQTSFEASHSTFSGFLYTFPLDCTGMVTPWYGFDATLSSNANVASNARTLQWDWAIFDKGRAYDPDTGIFTAPLSGLYFFAVNTRSPTQKANVDIMADDVRVCRIYSKRRNDAGSCQGAVELSKGQRVWVQSYGTDNSYRASSSTFTGFLYTHSLDCADLTTQPSIFNVRLSSNKNITSTILWDEVILNHGQAYNPSTGSFTAPVSGQYFFAVTTSSYKEYVYANIMAGDVKVCRVEAPDRSDASSCRGAVHLCKGQQVWVELMHKPMPFFLGEDSSFTGFLIQADSD